jgi:hypothetical protein
MVVDVEGDDDDEEERMKSEDAGRGERQRSSGRDAVLIDVSFRRLAPPSYMSIAFFRSRR